MINRSLSLAVSILFALAPLASAGPAREAAGSAAERAGAPVAAAPSALTSGIGSIQAADVAAPDAPEAAALAAAAAAGAEALPAAAEAGRLTQAVGAQAAARLEASAASADPVASRRARAKIARILAGAESWKRAADDAGVVPGRAMPSRSGLSRFVPRMRAAATGLAMMAGLISAPAVLAHPGAAVAPAVAPHARLVLVDQRQVSGPLVMQAQTLEDAVAQWRPGTRVVIVGDVTVDRGYIDSAADYLKDKDGVLLLVQDANDVSYKGHYGLEAVDYAVSSGLFSKVDAASAVDARDGQRDGYTFGVVIQQRKTYFHGSPAMRAEGLAVDPLSRRPGERLWNHDLEDLSHPGLRANFNVNQAVRDVDQGLSALVTQSIDRKLAAVKAAEDAVEAAAKAETDFRARHAKAPMTDLAPLRRSVAAAEAAAAQKHLSEAVADVDGVAAQAADVAARLGAFDRTVADASRQIADAKAAVDALASAQADFGRRHPKAVLADLTAMRAAVAKAEGLLKDERPGDAAAAVAPVRADAKTLTDSFAALNDAFDNAAREIARAEKDAAAVKKANPSATGDVLANANVRAFRDQVAASEARLGSDPQGSLQALRDVARQAGAAADALEAFPGKFAEIRDLRGSLSRLQAEPYAGAASDLLTSADQELRQAAAAHGDFSSDWSAHADKARQALDQAELSIDQAASAAAFRFHALMTILGLLTLGGLGIGFFLHRGASRARAKAKDELKKWDDAMEQKQSGVIDHVNALLKDYVKPDWTGKTLELSNQADRDVRRAKILIGVATHAHDNAKSLIDPASFGGKLYNFFRPGSYEKAVRQLKDEPITWDPKDQKDLETVFGLNKSEWDKVTADMGSYGPISMSVNKVIAEFNARMNAAKPSLETIQKAVNDGPEALQRIGASIAEAAKLRQTLADADGQFQGAALFDAALPAAQKLLDAAKETIKSDPVTGVDGQAADAQRVAADVAAFAAAVTAARAGALAQARSASAALETGKVGNAWIAAERAALSAQSDRIAAETAQKPVADELKALTESLAALAQKAGRAVEDAKTLAGLNDRMEKGEKAIESARREIHEKLGIDADKAMREKNDDHGHDADPSSFLAAAGKSATEAKSALDAGKLDEAETLFADVKTSVDTASNLTQRSLASLQSHEATAEARRMENERLKGLVPDHQRILKSIEDEFAPSVLKLGAGDPSHPGANDTVSDNIEEAQNAIDAAVAKRDSAMKIFKEGRLLEAAALLDQAAAHEEIAALRLEEIDEKRQRLDQAVAANKAKREALDALVRTYDQQIAGDRRTMQPTLAEYASVKTQVQQAGALVDQKQGDPFLTQRALAAAEQALAHVNNAARNDLDAYAELGRALDAARTHVQEADRQMRQSLGDAGESGALHQDIQQVLALEQTLKALADQVAAAAHADWQALDRQAEQIGHDASILASAIRGEQQAAARAAESLRNAAGRVRDASSWRGDFGVSVPGTPGSGSLNAGRGALANGDYAAAQQYADQAANEAAAATAIAVAEVARLQRQKEEEEERRREEQRRREQEEEDRRRASEDHSSWSSGSSSGDSGGFGGSSGSGGDSGSF